MSTAPRSSGSPTATTETEASALGCKVSVDDQQSDTLSLGSPAVRGFGGVLKEIPFAAAKNAPENAAKTLGTGLGNSGQLLEVVLLHMRVKASECG